MSYATIEAGIATVIKKHTDFDATNVFQADFRVLTKGKSRCIVLTYGGFSKEQLTLTQEKHIWTTNADIYVPWKGQADDLEILITTEAQKLVDIFQQYPRLDAVSGVIMSVMSTAAMPDLLSIKKGRYRGKRHTIITEEAIDPSRQE